MRTAKNWRTGFTLIELMIGVAITATLAAIAIPSYQNYAMKAKVSELVLAVAGAKVPIAENCNLGVAALGTGVTVPTVGKISAT